MGTCNDYYVVRECNFMKCKGVSLAENKKGKGGQRFEESRERIKWSMTE